MCNRSSNPWLSMAARRCVVAIACLSAAIEAADVEPPPSRPPQPPTSRPDGAGSPDRAATQADAARLSNLASRLAEEAPASPLSSLSAAQGAADDPQSPAARRAAATGVNHAGGGSQRAETNAIQVKQSEPARAAAPRSLGPRSLTPTISGDAAAPQAGGGSWVLSTLTALGVVLLAIFACRGLLRRWFGGSLVAGATPAVQVLARTAVAPRNHVLLLRVGARILVVGDSAAGLRTLASIDDDAEVADLLTTIGAAKSASASGGFRQLLQTFNRAYRRPQVEVEEGGDDKEFAIERARNEVSTLIGKMRGLKSGGDT